MKRLLNWLGFRSKEKPQIKPAGRAANNGIYFGSAYNARPTWGDADPAMLDVPPTFENYGGIQDFGGGDTDGAGAGGSWDDGGSTSDSSSDCGAGE